ncbi:hypothetical protein GCM10009754_11530 [Amycolatopsis minnesotensis]|uniref:Nbr1 FW domain-containing protein n=1 Tax=Amycolatopsis minnesotensis TaxID=337894 RepID=A0ABP5BHG8_9PSEU
MDGVPSNGKRGRRAVRPDPADGPVAEFAHRLWELKDAAGDPSYDRMRDELGAAASRSALSAAARGRELPSWETTWEFVRCLAVSRLGDNEAVVRADWQARWSAAREAAAQAPGPGLVPAPAPESVPAVEPAVESATTAGRAMLDRRRLVTVVVVVVVVLIVAAGVAFFAFDGKEQQAAPPPADPYPVPGDASEFVRDVSIPDGSGVRRGQQFVKVWELRNTGSVRWVDRYLQRVGGSETTADCRTPARVPVPTTEPGHTVQVAVPVDPQGDGICKVYWKMVDTAGKQVLPAARGVYFLVTVTA